MAESAAGRQQPPGGCRLLSRRPSDRAAAQGLASSHDSDEPRCHNGRQEATMARTWGLVFCSGLFREATVVARFYRERGFTGTSAVCKMGGVPKERIGVRDDQKIAIGSFESLCNPITQAEIMNAAGTDLNVVLGLSVGHDSLVFRHSQAPCTVLAAKDRILGHNPLAAVYTMQGYYAHLTRTP
jgi:uncharacterized metal-binding protein